MGGFSSSEKTALNARRFYGRVTQQLLESLPEKPEIIFHLAGGSSVTRSIENPRQDFELTVQGVFEVLEYLRVRNPECRLVHISSAAVYGQSAGSNDGSKENTLRPISPYGVHKMLSEQLCEYYSRTAGLKIVIVRPYSVYGPGLRKQLLWDALQKADCDRCAFFGTGDEIRDWVYVEDLSRLLLYAGIESFDTGISVIDAGTGLGTSVKEILTMLFECYGKEIRPTFLGKARLGDPDILIAPSGRWSAVTREFLTTELRQGLQRYVGWYRQEKGRC